MSQQVYIIGDNIISPLGQTSEENYQRVVRRETGITRIEDPALSSTPFYGARICEAMLPLADTHFTRFEKLCVESISDALSQSEIQFSDPETVFILSTTKGNIELLANGETDIDISLSAAAEKIAQFYASSNKPVIVSNACISGVLAIITAKRLLASGRYKHAVVTGADVLSKFVVSGFQSLMAISDEECRPFDKERKGINLGEGAGTVIMTTDKSLTNDKSVLVMGEGLTNDSNHISGPSRSGAELADAATKAMHRSDVKAADLSFVSAHGTATIYNDEMESKAFEAAGLIDVPLHSLKGNFGHTLGAAGIIETIISIYSLRNKTVLPSRNYAENGVPGKINVNAEQKPSDKTVALKTASGFGGCNAALVLSLVS